MSENERLLPTPGPSQPPDHQFQNAASGTQPGRFGGANCREDGGRGLGARLVAGARLLWWRLAPRCAWAKNRAQPGPGGKLRTAAQAPAPGHNNLAEGERPECIRKRGAGARKWARAFSLRGTDSRIFRPHADSALSSALLVRFAHPGERKGRWCPPTPTVVPGFGLQWLLPGGEN